MPINNGNAPSATAVINPWKKPEINSVSPSFRELMDNDLAQKLQTEEDEKYAHQIR